MDFEATGRDPDFQAIGRKGLRQVLTERGMFQKGMLQGDVITALQQCDDFSKLDLTRRAHVTTLMSARDHLALFGVKYHAEFAWIELKWMEVKRRIRKMLDGRLATLKHLVCTALAAYTVTDARKAARHCRDTMEAYATIGSDPASLQQLRAEELKMKGHRRVFDSSDGLLKLKSGIQLTVQQQIQAHKTQTARRNKVLKAAYQQRSNDEWQSRQRRKHRMKQTQTQIESSRVDSKIRKKKMLVSNNLSKQLTLKEFIQNVSNSK